MAYAENILPRSASYYTLNRASIEGTDLVIDTDGYAEINISKQMLTSITPKMLIVVHPSVFSNHYFSDAVQVTLSILTEDGTRVETVIPASEQPSGVFNTEVLLPEGNYVDFTYRISSSVPVRVYNWELCAEEAADVTEVIEGVEQAIPKLLYDYNTYSYAVAQREFTVGLITCYLRSHTDLQGHFTISFFATERCNVHVRIKDNNVTELFSPQVYTVEKGYASVSIPHAYLNKHATDHAFSVTLQCTNGQLSIPVRGVLYTIDGGYLATRLLDAGVDVQDISIRQLSVDSSPSEIWAVGFEGNRLLLKRREYSNLLRANWTAVKDFGEGITARVEFTGKWLSRANTDRYTIETEEFPHVFILTNDGVLLNYSGSSFELIETLDTGVSNMSACQGFSSMYNIEQNQGLIIAYVKNGNIYYRQRLYNTAIEDYQWFPVETLYTKGDASFVSVHRLPDYRVGFCVSHTGGTKWYITDRTYVSQAVKTELISSYNEDFRVFTVIDTAKLAETDASKTATKNEFSSDDAPYFNGFVMTFEWPLVILEGRTINDLKNSIVVTVNNRELDRDKDIKSITLSDNSITVILTDDVYSNDTVTIKYNFIYLVAVIYNNCYMCINDTYTWKLPVKTIRTSFEESAAATISSAELNVDVIPLARVNKDYINVVPVEIQPTFTCEVKQLGKPILPIDENINVNISSNITTTVSLVGYSPI